MCWHVQNSRNILDILSYTICDLSTVNDAIYITKTSIPPLHYFTHCKTVKSKSHFIRVSTKHHSRLLSQLILAVCVKERDFHLHFFSSPLSFPSPSSISLGLGRETGRPWVVQRLATGSLRRATSGNCLI